VISMLKIRFYDNMIYLHSQKCASDGTSLTCRLLYVLPRTLPSQTSNPASANMKPINAGIMSHIRQQRKSSTFSCKFTKYSTKTHRIHY
jgi:hypothetical protein